MFMFFELFDETDEPILELYDWGFFIEGFDQEIDFLVDVFEL
jgi:hypothetical protein